MMIHENDKVEIRTYVGNPRGVIKEIYMFDSKDPILLVQLESDEVIKCHASDIVIIKEEPKLDTISITREDFNNIKIKVTNPDMYKDSFTDRGSALLMGLVGLVICDKIENELFGEKK